MKITDIVRESFVDWGNQWVHYTDHPMLTISPQQFHQDPAGIYFFPAKINPTANMWHEKAYRFTAQLKPGTSVLDIAAITDEQIAQMVQAAGPEVVDKFNAYITQYPSENLAKKFRMAWERIRAFYAYEGGKTRQFSSFNATLRRLGWDALFDDTGSIHSGEKEQLLVLNPKVLTNIKIDRQSGGGQYAALKKVRDDVMAIVQLYQGSVTETPIKKVNRKAYYADQDNMMMGNIRVENPQNDGNYASIYLYVQKKNPHVAVADIRYSSPDRRASLAYHIGKGNYDEWHNLDRFQKAFTSIFDNPVAEAKKLSGPKVAGSGKDFRQNAGVNRSGKQPGRLMGSGKPMKVKPGFVG